MKDKGFTLVELMAVIILIGLLAVIVSIPVNKLINDAREKLNNSQKQQLELAAKNWATDNPLLLPPYIENKEELNITLGELKNEGYLEDDVVNMINNENVNMCSYIKITLQQNTTNSDRNIYSYKFVEVNECEMGAS